MSVLVAMNHSIIYDCHCSSLNRSFPLKIVNTSPEDIARFFGKTRFIEYKYIWDGSGYRVRKKNHCKKCRDYDIE